MPWRRPRQSTAHGHAGRREVAGACRPTYTTKKVSVKVVKWKRRCQRCLHRRRAIRAARAAAGGVPSPASSGLDGEDSEAEGATPLAALAAAPRAAPRGGDAAEQVRTQAALQAGAQEADDAAGPAGTHLLSLAQRQGQFDGGNSWGRSWFSSERTRELFFGTEFIHGVLRCVAGVGDHDDARAVFDAAMAQQAPDWSVAAVNTSATDVILHACVAAGNVRGMARARAAGVRYERTKVAVPRGCWGGGRGALACASLELWDPMERAAADGIWINDGLVVSVELPYRARASTFGPPVEPLTEADVAALAALEACLEHEPIGVLLLEAWRFFSGGCWLTPAVYQRVRAICTRLGIAIVMDEAHSACRTGRFFAHEWLLPGGAPAADMRPDAIVLGTGAGVAALLLPTQPAQATEVVYTDFVTSGGPTLELLQGARVLQYLRETDVLNIDRQRRLHELCATEAAAQVGAARLTHGAQAAAPLAVWGTCGVWYRSVPQTGSPAWLWSEAPGHARLVLPVDIDPAAAPERLR